VPGCKPSREQKAVTVSRLDDLLGIAVHPVTLRLVAALPEPAVTAAPQERGRTHRHGRAPTVQRRSPRSARITGDAILLPPPRRSAGLRAVIKSPLRCAGVTVTQSADSRPTVCLCIGALRANIRICRWEREEISRDLRQS
jgi:hypothetical protein